MRASKCKRASRVTGHDGIDPGMGALAPHTWCGEPAAGHELALLKSEPILIPVSLDVDDSGWSATNQLRGVMRPSGWVSFSVQHPGVVKAWHRRPRTIFWMCVQGHARVGVHRETDGASWAVVFGERRPALLIVPPSLWLGAATVGQVPAGLMCYMTEAGNCHGAGEESRDRDSVHGFDWELPHGSSSAAMTGRSW